MVFSSSKFCVSLVASVYIAQTRIIIKLFFCIHKIFRGGKKPPEKGGGRKFL